MSRMSASSPAMCATTIAEVLHIRHTVRGGGRMCAGWGKGGEGSPRAEDSLDLLRANVVAVGSSIGHHRHEVQKRRRHRCPWVRHCWHDHLAGCWQLQRPKCCEQRRRAGVHPVSAPVTPLMQCRSVPCNEKKTVCACEVCVCACEVCVCDV